MKKKFWILGILAMLFLAFGLVLMNNSRKANAANSITTYAVATVPSSGKQYSISAEEYKTYVIPVKFSEYGWVTINSTGNYDTIGYVSLSSTPDTTSSYYNKRPATITSLCGQWGANQCSDDDGGSGDNFSLQLYVSSSSTTYYIWARMLDEEESGTFTVNISTGRWHTQYIDIGDIYVDNDYNGNYSYSLTAKAKTWYRFIVHGTGGGTYYMYAKGSYDTYAVLTDYSHTDMNATCGGTYGVTDINQCFGYDAPTSDDDYDDNFKFEQYIRGGYYYHLWVRTYSGTPATFTVRITCGDKEAPAIYGGTQNTSNSRWYFKNSTSISFYDNIGEFSYYKFSGGSAVYTSSVTLTSSNCNSSCTLYAYDTAGNYSYRTYYYDNVGPTISGGYYNSSNSKYWYKPGSTSVSFSDSGVGAWYYKINGGSSVYSTSVTLTDSNCGSSCYIIAYDKFSIASASRYFYKDATAPSVSRGAYYDGTTLWYKPSSTLYFADNGSGFNTYQLNSGSATGSTSLTLTTSNCGSQCTLKLTDRVGNTITYTVKSDTSSPYVECYDAVTDDSCDYSHAKERDITLSITDWQSGLATWPTISIWMMDYIPDDGESIEAQKLLNVYYTQGWDLDDNYYYVPDLSMFNNKYTGVVYIFIEVYRFNNRDDYLEFELYDHVYNYVNTDGYIYVNVDGSNMYEVGYRVFSTYFDNTGPNISVDGASTSWTKNSRTITISASDDIMGISAYTCDGSSWMNSTSSSHTCTFDSTNKTAIVGSKDSLGNASTTIVNVYVDKTAPSVEAVYSYNGVWTAEQSKIDIYASDTDSNIKLISAYCIAEVQLLCTWQNDSYLSIHGKRAIEGTYYAFVKDNAGNVGVSDPIYVQYDPVAPTISTTTVDNGKSMWYKPGVTTFRAIDDESGIDHYVINGDVVGTSNSDVIFSDCGNICTIKVYNNAGLSSTEKYYKDVTAPTLVIKRGTGEIATGDQLQYLTVAPAIKWPDKIASGTNDSGSGISYARICKDSYVKHIASAICQNVHVATDVETFGNYQFEDGYNYSINLVDALGNSTSKGNGEVFFYLLSATSVADVFEDNTEVVTLGNAPALQLSDIFSGIYVSNMLGSMTNAFQYIRIVTFNTDTVLNIEALADYVLDYGMTVSLASLYDGGLVTSADGQSSGRAIAYILCSDAACNATSDPVAKDTHGTINVSAESENTATVATVITPTLAVATRTTNSRSALVFMIALTIMVLLAVEVVFVSKLLRKKSS